MKTSVYYDEIDGLLLPQWILLPIRTNHQYVTYTVEAPFERFFPEDFHDELPIITVTQGALTKGTNPYQFNIHLPSVQNDLARMNHFEQTMNESGYFLVRIEDLEEVLQFEVRTYVYKHTEFI